MARLELMDRGILYINTDPAHYHVFASHSHPLQLSRYEFICTIQRGAGLYASDTNIALLRSKDGGESWTEEGFLYSGEADDRPYSYHDGFLSRMEDGTLVVLAFRADRSDRDRPMFSASGGLIDNDPVLFFSDDGGSSWTGPQIVNLPEGVVATPTDPVIELEDGSWLAIFDRWHGWDEEKPFKPRMLGFLSRDRGKTWGDMVVVADGDAEGKGFWHGKVIRLNDGRLFSMFWSADMTQSEEGPINLPLHYTFVDNPRMDWPMPQTTGIPGQTHWPVELPDGTVCAVYTMREADKPGFMCVLSQDGGKSWNLGEQVRLWDSSGWTHIGISIPDKYPRSHDMIAFGAPTLMATMDDELYASWWCTYNSLTHVRWAKLKIV